jgi:hypothetical protein
MARKSEARPKWAEDFLKGLRPPTQAQRKRRHEALERAWKNRNQLDIRPMTTTELVRSIREES